MRLGWGACVGGTSRFGPAPEAQSHLGDGRNKTGHSDTDA